MNACWFERHQVQAFEHVYESENMLREELHRNLVENSLPQLLRYEDRNSMAYSIESRVPFLTPELAQFIFSLPEKYLISNEGVTKWIFREAMRGIVPDVILDRKDKIGFATPEQKWLSVLRPWVDQVLNSPMSEQVPALVAGEMRKEWQRVLDGHAGFDFRVWRWLNLIKWAERFNVVFD